MILGSDFGFYAVKAIGSSAHGRRMRVTFPSVVSTRIDASFSLNGEDNIVVEFGDHKYLVGYGAVKRGAETVRKESAEWVGSPVWLSMFYATLSLLTDASHADVVLTVGLPLADFQRQKHMVLKTLLGGHTFKRETSRQQTLTVSQCFVVPQAWGAILSKLLDDNGNVVDVDLVSAKCAVIDVGGHNVNLLSVDGLTNVDAETHSTERGAWQIMRAVREHFEQVAPELCRHSDHRLMQAITLGQIGYGGETIDLTPIVNPLVSEIAEEIVDTATQRWGAGAKLFDRVFVIGGGAYLFDSILSKAIPHAETLDVPEFANALGYYRYSVYKDKRGEQ